MMTESEYLYAWLYYLAGVFILILALWFLVRRLPWPRLKYSLLVVAAVAMSVPWYSDMQYPYLSPAIIVSTVEGFFEGGEAFWRAGTPLLAAVGAATFLCALISAVLWYFGRSNSDRADDTPASISDIHLD
jgi:hypothetical protein